MIMPGSQDLARLAGDVALYLTNLLQAKRYTRLTMGGIR